MSSMAHILPDLSQPPGPRWHCAACGTTVTWAAATVNDPGMQKCPRCGKWMDRDEPQSPAFIAKGSDPGPIKVGR
jgi:ribosomal protein S27AE